MCIKVLRMSDNVQGTTGSTASMDEPTKQTLYSCRQENAVTILVICCKNMSENHNQNNPENHLLLEYPKTPFVIGIGNRDSLGLLIQLHNEKN